MPGWGCGGHTAPRRSLGDPVARGGAVSFHPEATGKQLCPAQKWLLASALSPCSSGPRMTIEGHSSSSLAAAPPPPSLAPSLAPPPSCPSAEEREDSRDRTRPGRAGGGAAPVPQELRRENGLAAPCP